MPEDAGSIYSSIFLKLDQLQQGVLKVNTILDGMGKKAKTQSEGFAGFWKNAFQTAFGFGIVQIINKVTTAIRNAVAIFSGFQQSMQNVKSVTGAVGQEFETMSDAAKEAGETTRFTAREAADALYYLGSAGFTAQQSIAALDGVLQLAGATQSDLASTAESLASIISQYNLQAEDAGRVSNVFAAAIGNSQATMEKLTNSFRQVGPVAAGFGYTVEETTGALQELYNAGFQGQQAGRALKSALADLASPTSNMEKIFTKLGISMDSVNPSTTEFADIIDILGQSGADTADIIDAFGKIAGPQMAVLIKQGGDALRKYTKDVTGTEAAAEMYKIQNDSLAGSMDFLKSKLEGTAIAIFEKLEPGMRDMIDSFISFLEAAKPLGILLGNILNLILKLGSIAIKPVTGIIKAMGFAFQEVRTPMQQAGDGLKKVTDSIKRAGELGNTAKKLNELTDEYEQLKSKTDLTESEQDRLKSVIMQIQKIMPDAIDNFDSYGNAIGVSGEKSREAAKQMLLAREATLQNALTTLKASEAIYKRTIRENEATAEAAKQNRNRLISESINAEARLAVLDTFLKKYNEFTKEIGKGELKTPFDAYNKALNEMDKSLKKVGITLKKGNLYSGIDPIKELYKEINKADKTLNRLQKSLSKPTKAEELYTESKKKLDEIIELEKEIADVQKDIATIDKVDPVGKGSDDKLKNLDKISREFWNNYRTQIEQATREASLFGDKQDELKASLDFLKNAYLELLEQGMNPASETMKKLRMEYDLTLDELNALIEAEKRQTEELQNKEKAEKDITDLTKDYYKKIEELGKSENELIEIERQRAIASIYASGASQEAMEAAIEAVNLYFDKLKENSEETKEKVKITFEEILSYAQELSNSLIGLSQANTDRKIEELDREMQAELKAAGLLEETKKERLEKELKEAKKAGDKEKQMQIKDDLKRLEIQEKYEKEVALIKYKAAMFEWNLKRLSTAASMAEGIAKAVASVEWPWNLPAIAFATGKGLLSVLTVQAQKPVEPEFDSGGLFLGPESKNGSANAVLHSPEMVLNQDQMGNLFNAINSGNLGGGNDSISVTVIYQVDGITIAKIVEDAANGGQITLRPERALRKK